MAKTWKRLKREVESSGISALVCRQSFEETRQDSIADNPDLTDEHRKHDVMFRILQENLDYGVFAETEDEDSDNSLHQNKLEARTRICDTTAWAWVAGGLGVNSIKEAQAWADGMIEEMS